MEYKLVVKKLKENSNEEIKAQALNLVTQLVGDECKVEILEISEEDNIEKIAATAYKDVGTQEFIFVNKIGELEDKLEMLDVKNYVLSGFVLTQPINKVSALNLSCADLDDIFSEYVRYCKSSILKDIHISTFLNLELLGIDN